MWTPLSISAWVSERSFAALRRKYSKCHFGIGQAGRRLVHALRGLTSFHGRSGARNIGNFQPQPLQ